ncbi:minor capsid protein [Bdellovibrio bacteriovorus]|uniref:minor capsid protein n=1 Tax=Bdellovibrio bacteriovorus TaxID=959 RepID=UPI003AA94376
MNLAAYNLHKRKTLDRMTGVYTAHMVTIMRHHLKQVSGEFYRSLEAGKADFDPAAHGVEELFGKVLKAHRNYVIKIAVADGIQEVSPENKLGAWEKFPLGVPVEKTLSVALAKKGDTEADRIAKRFEKKKQKSFYEVLKAQFDQHMGAIKKAYTEASKDWLSGTGTKADANMYLQRALKVSEVAAERIIRTETTAHFNDSRLEYFEANTSVDYVQIFAITDGRTSEICNTRHGFVVPISEAKKKKYMPPFHPNCRTVQRPLLSYLSSHKRLIEEGLKMDERHFAPLPRGWAAA